MPQQNPLEAVKLMASPEARKPKKQNKSPTKKPKTVREPAIEQQDLKDTTVITPEKLEEDESSQTKENFKIAAQIAEQEEQQREALAEASMTTAVEKEMSGPLPGIQDPVEPKGTVTNDAQGPSGLEVDDAKHTAEPTPTLTVVRTSTKHENSNSTPAEVAQSSQDTNISQSKENQESVQLQEMIYEDSTVPEPPDECPVEPLPKSPVDSPLEQATEQGTEETDNSVQELPRRKETASDDDLKNEISFHSAKESPSDTGKTGRVEEATPTDMLAHTDVLPPPASTTPKAPKQKSHDKVLGPKLMKTEQQQMAPGTVLHTKSTAPIPPPAEKVPTEKKKGAKQTESMSVFAQQKMQQKKEREAKKKEKKKAKTGKPASWGKQADGADAKATNAGLSDMATRKIEDKLESESHSVTGPISNVESHHGMSDDNQISIKMDKAASSAAEGKSIEVEASKNVGGKRSIPSHVSLTTTHDEVPSGSPMEMTKQEAQNTSSTGGGAQSCEHISSVYVPTKDDKMSSPASHAAVSAGKVEPSQTQTRKTKNDMKVAVPHLKLLNTQRSSPSDKATSSPTDIVISLGECKNNLPSIKGMIEYDTETSSLIRFTDAAAKTIDDSGSAKSDEKPSLVTQSMSISTFYLL